MQAGRDWDRAAGGSAGSIHLQRSHLLFQQREARDEVFLAPAGPHLTRLNDLEPLFCQVHEPY